MSPFRYISALLFLFTVVSGHCQLYTFKNFNHRDGLVTESTLSSAQDANGYLWVGTDGEGLMRFDGKRFLEMGPKNRRFPFHVSDIYHHTDGTVYFTTLYDGIYRLHNNSYEFIYKPSPFEGDCKRLSMVDSALVLITDRSITLLSLSGVPIRKISISEGSDFNVQQVLKTPRGVFIFTNQENYVAKNKRIVPLKKFLGSYYPGFKPTMGCYSKNKVLLANPALGKYAEITWWTDGSIIGNKEHLVFPVLSENTNISNVCEHQRTIYFQTTDNHLYKLKDGKISYIVQNYSGSISHVAGMSVDRNEDLWLNTSSGLFKISIEPFTRIELNPIYSDKSIMLVHRTQNSTLILGNITDQLYIGDLYGQHPLAKYNLRGYHVSESDFGTFVATNKGVYRLENGKLKPANFPDQSGKIIKLVHWDGDCFWYAEADKGIIRYDPKTKKATRYHKLSFTFPAHFYTAQNNFNKTLVYFGTNNGVLQFNKQAGTFKFIESANDLGSYCGNSTTDKFGTIWFTLDRGILGITRREDFVKIDNPKKLPSILFYTLTADQYGNLLAGTNRGINIIRVDQNGNVLHQKNYGNQEGFGGYETHMRSCFQNGNYSFVGTIEGLYLINTDILESYPLPSKPLVFFGRENENGEFITYDEKSYYTFKCILGKLNGVSFSYRIKGSVDNWSNFSHENEIYIPELSNGNYTLEVRASYDGVHFSETTYYPILINEPIWKSKWFIVVLIIILGLSNIGYLEWSKGYASNNLIETKDTIVDYKLIPKIILFGLIAKSIILFIARYIEPQFFTSNTINILFSSGMMICYLFSRYFIRNNKLSEYVLFSIYIAYGILVIEDFILIFQTEIHPFPVFSLTMATSILPYFIARVRWVIMVCLIQVFIGAALLIWLDNTVYNEILFIAALTIAGGLSIMVSYLRNDSLEKLIFVSGLVNKGHVMAISFNQEGLVSYCSSNISEYFNIDSQTILNKPLSFLNPIVVSSEMRETRLDEEFANGKVFLVPMYNRKNEIIWIEWSCKFLNNSVRVIMGQDVTEKLTVATNYESLVENAQDMIYNTDIHGNFVFANEQSMRLFGYKKDTIIGQFSLALVATDHRERVERFYKNQFKNQIHHTYLEFPIRSRDGRNFWVGQNVTMVYEPGSRKRITGFIALARDITEKRANDLLIEQQNKDITSSINSAKRIQFNLLPKPHCLNEFFDESFVIFKPKDIVSGDFYWIEKVGNKLIVVLADCTGHGVPGAFMTIVGINLLNQLVRERKLTDPAAILTELNEELKHTLPTNENGTYMDGMDVLITVFEGNTCTYATNGVGLIHVHNNELHFIRSTKFLDQGQEQFSSNEILLDTTDIFYLITDGYQKQFGSIRNKKFTNKRLQELLEKIHPESLPLQKKYFENAWRNWSDGHEQTDDITVIAVKGFRQDA